MSGERPELGQAARDFNRAVGAAMERISTEIAQPFNHSLGVALRDLDCRLGDARAVAKAKRLTATTPAATRAAHDGNEETEQ